MKHITFLFICILVGGALQAQETIINKERLQERAQQYLQKIADTTGGKMPNIAIAPGGNRVVALPQDGMPCIVPDTRGLVPMPNAVEVIRTPEAGRMPNAWNGRMKVMPVR